MSASPGALNSGLGLAQMLSGILQSQAARDVGEYESRAMKANARVAELQAVDAIARGNREASQHMQAVAALVGQQRAALAAQGIDLTQGTAMALQEDTARQGAIDVETIKANAWREAWGYRSQAGDMRSRAAMAKLGAQGRAQGILLTAGLESARTFLDYYSPKMKDEVPVAPRAKGN